MLHWQSNAIVNKIHCVFVTIYKIQQNFFYDETVCSHYHIKNRSIVIYIIVQNSLIQYFKKLSCIQQTEMIWFLWRKKWKIRVHRFTISKMLIIKNWNAKKSQRLNLQNEKFRQHWQIDMLNSRLNNWFSSMKLLLMKQLNEVFLFMFLLINQFNIKLMFAKKAYEFCCWHTYAIKNFHSFLNLSNDWS